MHESAASIPAPGQVIYASGQGELDLEANLGTRVAPIGSFGPAVAIFEGCRLASSTDPSGGQMLVFSSEGEDGRTQATIRFVGAELKQSSLAGDIVFEAMLLDASAEPGSRTSGFTEENLAHARLERLTIRVRVASRQAQ